MTKPERKPSLFIGSSREAMKISQAVHACLKRSARVLPWYQGTFGVNEYTMESLEKRLDSCDFGVFVFAPDDVAVIRGKPVFITRDNTIFEMGLFWGRLRRGRVFCLIPQEIESSDGAHIKDVIVDRYHLLSDLGGLTILEYEHAFDGEYEAAVSEACGKIARIIEAEQFYQDPAKKLKRSMSLVKLFWEYSRRVPVTAAVSLGEKYHALFEAIRISFIPPDFGRYSVTHVALYAKQGNDAMTYAAGNMDEGKSYSFSGYAEGEVPIVIEVQRSSKWKFTHVQHIEKVSILCYPLGNDHVLSVYLTGDIVLSGEAQQEVVEINAELLTTIKHLVGGDSR